MRRPDFCQIKLSDEQNELAREFRENGFADITAQRACDYLELGFLSGSPKVLQQRLRLVRRFRIKFYVLS